MPHLFEATQENITCLDPEELTDLAIRLVALEAKRYQIPQWRVSGTLDINMPDAGDDVSIRWERGPEETDWLASNSVIQCKASSIGPSACRDEVLEGGQWGAPN